MVSTDGARLTGLLDLPEAVLQGILQRLPRLSRVAVYQTCHCLRTSAAMACFLKTELLLVPSLLHINTFACYPKPVKQLQTIIINVDMRLDQTRRQLHRMLMACEKNNTSAGRAKSLLAGVKVLDFQGMSCPEKHMHRLVQAMSRLLHLCINLEKLLLPQVPAHLLPPLLDLVPQHPNIKSLTVLSWLPTGEAYSSQITHVPSMMARLTQLTGLDFTVVGCTCKPVMWPAGAEPNPTLHTADGQVVAEQPGSISMPMTDLTPLSALTDLTSLSLHLRASSNGGHYSSSVVTTGLHDIANQCTALQRLEVRSRIRSHPLDEVPPSKVLWPSLRHALFHESVVPDDVVSLQLHRAPHLACVEVPQGIDIPLTPTTTPAEIQASADQLHHLTTCLSRCTVPTTELRMHHLIAHDRSQPYYTPQYEHHDRHDGWTHDFECAPLMYALAPLAPKLTHLHATGSFLSTPAAASALGASLPELQLLSVLSVGAPTIAALPHAIPLLHKLNKLELFVGRDSSDMVQAVTHMLVCFQDARRKLAAEARRGSGVPPLKVMLIGCGWAASQAVPQCVSAWQDVVTRAGWTAGEQHVQLLYDHLPDM